jgi:hypothetical protein
MDEFETQKIAARNRGNARFNNTNTRGTRKFGRPDISVHKLGPCDLCNRFIELLAFAGLVEDGEGNEIFHKGSETGPTLQQ